MMFQINLKGVGSRAHTASFCNWVDDKDNTMMTVFGSAVFHRGREYLARIKIRNVKEGLVKAKAFGQSEIPYKLEVWYDANSSLISGGCACPFGGNCKHLVALLLKIRKFSEAKMGLFMMVGHDGNGGDGRVDTGAFQLPILEVGELEDMSASLQSYLIFLPRMELIQLVQRFAPITFKQGIQRQSSRTPQQLSNDLDDIKVEFSELLAKTDYQSAKGFEMALGVLLDDLRPYITIDPPSILGVLQSVIYGTDAKLSRGELFSGGGAACSGDDEDGGGTYPVIDNGDNDAHPLSSEMENSSDFNGRDLVAFAADFILSQPDEFQCRYFRAVYNALCDTQYMCEIDVTARILKVHQLHNCHSYTSSSGDMPITHAIPRPQMSTALIAMLVKEKTFSALSDLAQIRFHETFPNLYLASKEKKKRSSIMGGGTTINGEVVVVGAKRERECYIVEDSDADEEEGDEEEQDDNQTVWTTSTSSSEASHPS